VLANSEAFSKDENQEIVGTIETIFIWFTILLVSLPWLSYILMLSFLKTTRKKKVSMTNALGQFCPHQGLSPHQNPSAKVFH
jgi:hypothetical protein